MNITTKTDTFELTADFDSQWRVAYFYFDGARPWVSYTVAADKLRRLGVPDWEVRSTLSAAIDEGQDRKVAEGVPKDSDGLPLAWPDPRNGGYVDAWGKHYDDWENVIVAARDWDLDEKGTPSLDYGSWVKA